MGGAIDDLGQAWDFWTKEGSFADAADAIGWGVKNPVTVAKTSADNFDLEGSLQSDLDHAADAAAVVGDVIETAAMAGTMYLVKGVVVVGAALIGWTMIKAYAVKKVTA